MKLSNTPVLLALLLAPVLAADGAAAAPIVSGVCATKYKYVKSHGDRWTAFAANRVVNGGQGCGWATGFAIRHQAVSRALSECRAAEREHPTWGKRGTCKILFVQ